MAHPYPPHRDDLPYEGKHRYFLTFCTDQRHAAFADSDDVRLVRSQILRAATERGFELTAYCFMPDHLHLLVKGVAATADLKAFVKMAKQYSGYAFKQRRGQRLWQRYCFERVIRSDLEWAQTIGYIVSNPVRASLAPDPLEYPHLGSVVYTVGELLQMSEYQQESGTDLPPEGGGHK